jgi:hypothetical protein
MPGGDPTNPSSPHSTCDGPELDGREAMGRAVTTWLHYCAMFVQGETIWWKSNPILDLVSYPLVQNGCAAHEAP